MTAQQYIGWALHDLVEYGKLKPLKTEFPDLYGKSRVFDASVVTSRLGRYSLAGLVVVATVLAILNAHRFLAHWFPGVEGGGFEIPFWTSVGLALLLPVATWCIISTSAVVVALKHADDLSFSELMAELTQLERLIPTPGSVDAFEYYGALVLVFEKPVPSAKRDKLIAMRRTSPLGRKVTDIYVVELDAGTMWAVDVPWNIRRFLPFLNGAFSHKGDAPPWAPPEAGLGQRTARTDVAAVGLALVGVMTLIHVAVHTEYAESWGLRLFRCGAENSAMIRLGDWWRMVSAIYLHANWDHIIGNLLGFFELARGVETLFGGAWLMALFVGTGFLANWITGRFMETGIGVGASGSVFGLAGVLVMVYIFRGERLSTRYRSHLFIAGAACLYLMARGLFHGLRTGVNMGGNWTHLAGFSVGAFIGIILPFKKEGGPSPWRGTWWGAAAVAASVWAAVMVGLTWDWTPAEFRVERSEEVRAAVESPGGWQTLRLPGDNAMVLTNYFGGVVVLERLPARIGWIFQLPIVELKHQFEEMYREGIDRQGSGHGRTWEDPWEGRGKREITTFEASEIPIAEGRALQLRFVVRTTVEILHYFLIPERVVEESYHEEIYLPLDEAALAVRIMHPVEDAQYYRPIVSRVKNTLKSLDKPYDYIAPQERR